LEDLVDGYGTVSGTIRDLLDAGLSQSTPRSPRRRWRAMGLT